MPTEILNIGGRNFTIDFPEGDEYPLTPIRLATRVNKLEAVLRCIARIEFDDWLDQYTNMNNLIKEALK